jgi:hypothetical protein
MKCLGTVVHRLTEVLPNHCQHRGNLYHNCIFNIISVRYNKSTKKFRKLIRNKLTRKQEQCVLFLLISRKFNTLCFLSIVATLELAAMGAGLLPNKEPPFSFPTGA